MRQKKQKSEKQLEAMKLRADVISVNTSEVQSYCDAYKRNFTYCLCRINGDRYIQMNAFSSYMSNFISTMERQGRIGEGCKIHARKYACARHYCFIKTEFLLDIREEMMEYMRHCFCPNYDINKASCMYEAINDHSVELTDMVFTDDEIRKSEEAFSRRIELINEARYEREAEESMQRIKEFNERTKDEENNAESLQDLVAKIEAMGWDVSLRLKERL